LIKVGIGQAVNARVALHECNLEVNIERILDVKVDRNLVRDRRVAEIDVNADLSDECCTDTSNRSIKAETSKSPLERSVGRAVGVAFDFNGDTVGLLEVGFEELLRDGAIAIGGLVMELSVVDILTWDEVEWLRKDDQCEEFSEKK
jgi:hypothetical protein